jgi:hypothetical protein
MRHIFKVIFVYTFLVSPAFAQSFFVGDWAYPGGSCVFDHSASGAIRFSESAFWGTETECELTNPVEIRDMDGILFDMVCWGEGIQYTERMLILHENDGGLTIHSRGYTSTYTLCD